MKLMNLINFADPKKSMMLIIGSNEKSIAYNFQTKSWDDNALFRADKITTVEEFKATELYNKICKNELITWSSCHIRNISKLVDEGVRTYENLLWVIKISPIPHKSLKYQKDFNGKPKNPEGRNFRNKNVTKIEGSK